MVLVRVRLAVAMDTNVEITAKVLQSHGLDVVARAVAETAGGPADSLLSMLHAAVADLRRGLQQGSDAELSAGELQVLERGGFDPAPRVKAQRSLTDDPLAQGATEYAALLATAVSVGEAARRAGVSESRIRQRLTGKPPTLVGVKLHGGWRVPAFQFDAQEHLLEGLELVVPALDASLHPLALQRWFLAPHPELAVERKSDDESGLSPREWLARGLPAQALARLARNL